MNRETFLNIYNNKLMPDHKEILPLLLEGFSNKEIAEKQNVTPSAVSHRIKVIAEKFDCVSRENLIEIFAKYKPEVVGRKLLENYPNLVQPHFPDRPEPIDSPFYIERDHFESNLDSLLTESLIRITAPRKMGKTSLLKRILFHCKSKGWHTVYLNLSQVEDSKLQKEEDFIRLFYNSIIQELLSLSPSNEWDQNLSTMTNCTTNFQGLLRKLDTTFVLVIDEVDRLFEYPQIYQNFFPLLRNWYEKTNESKTWSKLKLVIAYSTEDYGKLDIDQSPLNVGRAIKLQEFTPLQVQNLASRHGLERGKIYPLIDLVGGHPFLIRLAFYHLFYEEITLEDLTKEAATDSGIYRQHLLSLFNRLQTNPELKQVFYQVLNQQNSVELKDATIPLYQLESMGLIVREGNIAKISCELYRQYFKNRLA